MAFAIIVEIPGGTLAQYEKVSEVMHLKGTREASPGLVVHFAGLTGDTLTVIDVWESREAYERHLAELGEEGREAIRKVGLPPYTHREFEVYNLVK
ncbi:MAG: hypothetical protein MUP15_03790 [Dehalococcoidia bacterium]|nr:hypothetical protein [Dehalococcoidia bacterium]